MLLSIIDRKGTKNFSQHRPPKTIDLQKNKLAYCIRFSMRAILIYEYALPTYFAILSTAVSGAISFKKSSG